MNEYPTEEVLERIKRWREPDFNWIPLMEFVKENWKYQDRFYFIPEESLWKVSTGGWSGNEDLIAALGSNALFWALCAMAWKRGGYYEFETRPPSIRDT